MRKIIVILGVFLGFNTVYAQEKSENKNKQTVSRAGSLERYDGPASFFTGKVFIESVSPEISPSRNGIAYVTFQPGARSNWHDHPAGQTLVVVSGVAWTQEWDGPVHEAKAGDVIYCPPNVKHWHGAASDVPMTHVSIVESVNGKNVNWMEPVTDEQYNTGGKAVTKENSRSN